MKKKKWLVYLLTMAMAACSLSGCGASADGAAPSGSKQPEGGTKSAPEQTGGGEKTASGQKVRLKLFTGKIETIDVMDEIIEAFNASQDRIEVEQEYQKDASNIIKIKFASGEVPDIMTTYEQGFVDEGKYLDLSERSEWWDRLSPSMKEACTDVKTGKQYRICTNMDAII